MNSTPTILFRADAGPDIGLGHLQRSLALATALETSDIPSVFLVNEDAASHKWVRQHGFPVVGIGDAKSWTEADTKATLEAASIHGCGAVMVDYHEAGAAYLAGLREAGLFVIARDDLALYPFPCQMVVNGNVNAPRLPYCSSSEDTSFFLGTPYMVLKKEFWGQLPRVTRAAARNVLVILGGTDQHNLMPKILNLLDEVRVDFTVTAVAGPFFHDVEAVKGAARSAKRPIKVIPNPSTVCDLMLEADLAVSAAGQTLYELAAVGCPTIAFAVAANQLGQLEALAESGFLVSAGDAEKDDVIAVTRQAVSCLLPDVNARSVMAAVGQGLVDGGGAMRVARAIVGMSGSLSPDFEEVPDAAAFPGG